MLVVPSVKYHLPAPDETTWREEEYRVTTPALVAAAADQGSRGPIPLEMDFSPTLAGSSRAAQKSTVLEWLRRVPELIRQAAPAGTRVLVGLKLFNSLFDDDFQLAMLALGARGPLAARFRDLRQPVVRPCTSLRWPSRRGLRRSRSLRPKPAHPVGTPAGAGTRRDRATRLPISATGDISSGRIAVEYLLRGCTSFQIHTLFQLPAGEFEMRQGTKVEKALHQLCFHPESGLVVWALHAARRLGIARGGVVRLLDIARRGSESALARRDLDSQRL